MKNLFNSLIAVAVAAMTIMGCSKDPENLTPDRGGFTLNLIADGQIAGDTRTEYDPVLKNIKWSEGDIASFYVNTTSQSVTATLTDNIATFSLKGLTPGTLNIQGYFPSSASWAAGGDKKTADKITAYAMTLPAAQTATTATFDPAADILIARNMDDVAVTETTKELSVRFGRPVAISKFTYKITNSTLSTSTEKVKSIALKVVSDGKYIAGNFYFNPTIGHFVEVDGETEAMPELDAFADAKSNEVVVTLSDQPAVNGNFDGWFVTSPVLIEVADQLVFTITTDAGTVITKTVTPSKELQFTNSKLNTLTVNIDNSVTIEKADIAIYTCGFEAAEGFDAGTDYQSTTTTGPANMQWYTYYGNTSAVNPSGTEGQNMQCRWYTASKTAIGYTQMTFDITKATYVTFNAASTGGLQVKAEYSTDQGATWQNAETFTLATTYGAPFNYTISKEGITARVKFSVVLPAKAPTSNSRLYLDNVTVYGKEGGKLDVPVTIIADDITDVPASGVTNASHTFTVLNDDNYTASVTYDGQIVSEASVNGNSITYSVASNTGNARKGWITIKLNDPLETSKTIEVNQLSGLVEYIAKPADIANKSAYDLYENDDWIMTCGSNNGTLGANSTQAGNGKMRLGTYFSIAAPLDNTITATSDFYSAVISKKALSGVGKITISGTIATNMQIGVVYSTDNTTWEKLADFGTVTTFTFETKTSAYYAVVIKATSKSNAQYKGFVATFSSN